MKTVNEVFFDSNPKNLDKLNKAMEKSNSLPYATAFSQELSSPACADFQDFHVFVSNSFVCSYNFGALKYDVTILPINEIGNVYRCNIVQGEYDFDNFYLVAEMTNGQTITLAKVFRNRTKNINVFDQAVANIRSKKAGFVYGGNQ